MSEAKPLSIWAVRDTASEPTVPPRLVRAKSSRSARNHVTAERFTSIRASQSVLVDALERGQKVEEVVA